MNRTLRFILLPLLLLALLCGCGEAADAPGEQTELVVFAAASLTEALTELGDRYMDANQNVTIVFNFDSSGTLKTQIQEGTDCDVFLSAAPKQMDQLDISASAEVNTEGLDFVLAGSRINLLENKVALAVPEGNPAGITDFAALADALNAGRVFLAMGNSDVPVGQYSQKILNYFELDEDALAAAGAITYGSNVKEIVTQIGEGVVDCGIVYQTDAYSAGLTVADTAARDMCGQVIYPAAVLNVSKNPEAAQDFLTYLTTPEAAAAFEAVGFTPVA